MMSLVVGLRRQHCLVATALLVECKGLRSPCGRLMTTSVVGLRRQHCLVATALLVECEGLRSPCGCLMMTLVVGTAANTASW
jgi:hypothetical protein